MRSSKRKIIILVIEIIIAAIFILRCFGNCAEYILQGSDFHKSFDGELICFDDGSIGIEAWESGESEIMNYALDMKSGAYSVTVIYDSVRNYDVVNMDNCAGRISFGTENPKVLRASEIQLRDGQNEIQSRIWLRAGSGENSVKISVRYYGNGKLAIKRIVIEEKREYRIITCLAMLILIAACNLFYVYFVRKGNVISAERKRFVIAGIAAITLFSSITYLTDFLYVNWGHDLHFHLSRITSLANALKESQIPHRMQFELLNGYGYASPLYYGELFLLLPAVLYNFYLPVQTCYQIFVICVNFFTAILSYWCFMKMSQDWKKGLLGSLIYTTAAYRLTDVMVRAAVGEYTALIFFPLLLYGFWVIYNKEDKIVLKDYLPIVVSATGIVNSHILSCEMLIIFIIPFVILNYKRMFRKNTFIALLKSTVLTVLLNIWFLLPFIQSMGMKINIANRDSILRIESNTVSLAQILGIFHTAAGMNIGESAKNEMPLAIGLPFVLGICLCIFVFIKKDSWDLPRRELKSIVYCFAMGIAGLFLASDLCKWNNLINANEQVARIAGMVQFPWRYLGIATVLFTAATVLVMKILERHMGACLCNGIMLFIASMTVLTEGHFMMEYVNAQDETRVYSESDYGTMTVMNGEYLLEGTDTERCKQRNILGSENVEYAEFYYETNGQYCLSCKNPEDNDTYIDIPVFYYENYHAYKYDDEELPLESGDNNRIRICVPAHFEGNISIKYEVPALWRICEKISLITACAIILCLSAFSQDKYYFFDFLKRS